MRYISTRGGAPPASFADILLEGLAPDGGLYVPETWPELTFEEIAGFATWSYANVAADILSRFVGDSFTREELREDCRDAYASFAHPAVAPLRQLDVGLWLLELFHGPTLAFKDVAMQLLARLYERALTRLGRKLTIVCATSGDTGGAAVEAFRGSAHVDLVVLFPEGRISEVQRRFMTTTEDANVRCVAVEGDFDACQAIVKAMFADAAFKREVDLSGVNSINWARIAAQAVYYFTSAVALGAPDRRVSFAVPTGNFGDAFAGWVAHRMGLPIERIVVATNSNAILSMALMTGSYTRGEAVATQSPAMDIQVASNFERLYFEMVGRDAAETASAFRLFTESRSLSVPSQALALMQQLLDGVAVFEHGTEHAMRLTSRTLGVLVDPHTAVALSAAETEDWPKPLVVLSTAHPAKFPDAVEAATGRRPGLPPNRRDLHTRVERIDRLPADTEAVKSYIRAFAPR